MFLRTLVTFGLIGLLPWVSSMSTLGPTLSNNYRESCTTLLPNGVPMTEYISTRTGIRIILAKVEGPMVGGYFTFATEASDDDGLPHTLEHLVFLGSELYPYKGVLDLLANKCLASGTNAWTAADSTTYTLETAGSEGFLNLLPIYLDHMLYPTMTDAGFLTEVYHVTGEGEDAGVVYSEMVSRSSSASDRSFNAFLSELYPEPSGYRYETGGLPSNLRNSTNNKKIRAYHKAFYRPENFQIVVAGQVDPETLLSVVNKYEDRIVSKGSRPPFSRPWQSPIPRLNGTRFVDVVYPSTSLKTGRVMIGFRGPSVVTDYPLFLAVEILLSYLTWTSVAPLPEAFVDGQPALASSVSRACVEYGEAACYLQFKGVPVESIEQIGPKLYTILRRLRSEPGAMNVEDIQDVLRKQIVKAQSKIESSPRSVVAGAAIDYFLYGNKCTDLSLRADKINYYNELIDKPVEFWKDLIRTEIIEAPLVVVRARPSKEEADRIKEETKMIVEERKRTLGVEGLLKKEEELTAAKAINEVPPPEEMLESLPVPSIDSISYHYISPYSNHLPSVPSDAPDFMISEFPFRFQLDDIHSDFVTVMAVTDTSVLTAQQRMYIPLLTLLLFESDIQREDGSVIPYEEVVTSLSNDVLSSKGSLSLSMNGIGAFSSGSYMNYFMFTMKMEASKYETGLTWLYDVMFNSRFSIDRIQVKLSKLLKSIPAFKTSAPSMLSLMGEGLIFQRDSNQNQVNFLRQQKFLEEIKLKVDNEETAEAVVADLENILSALTQLSDVTFHMATDIRKLAATTDIAAPWARFQEAANLAEEPQSLVPKRDPLFKTPEFRYSESFGPLSEDVNAVTAYVSGQPSLESGYLQLVAPSISDVHHEDVPALLAAIKYLTQLEGPMWKEIRGRGLAYNYRLNLLLNEGTISLKLNKAAQLVKAYDQAVELLEGYINGSRTWEQPLLDTAKSSQLYSIISRESSILSGTQQSLMSYFRGVSHSYNRNLLPKVASITLDDVRRVAQKYFPPLIDARRSRSIVVVPVAEVPQITDALIKYGHVVQDVSDLENSIFA